ncbi:MAG: exosortase [Massilia sp.]|nr:exosortase [Massilia sp.]
MIRKSIQQSPVAARSAFRQLLCAAAVSAAAIVPVHAGTINFEGYFGPTVHGDYIQTGGYDIGFYSLAAGAVFGEDLVGSFLNGADSQSCDVATTRCPVNNPSTYYANLNDGLIDVMSNTAASRFSINGFDASFIGGNATLSSYPAVSGLLRIQGFFANGTSLYETYDLAGPSTTGFNFAHYNTSAGFSSNAFVEAYVFGFACNSGGTCSAFSSDRGQFAIDNLSLNAVPEPASFALFGIGMIGMGAVARRRRASL